MANKNLFNPVMGTEERVQAQSSSPGAVYFTTDTRKIYLDFDNEKLPMGGNIGLFYGNMKLDVPVSDEQKEFEFKMSDIVGNEDGINILVPNVNDLILNSDGCFYKVLSVDGNDIGAFLNTEKLTIAGTGGGGSGGSTPEDGSLASFKVGKFQYPKSVLQGKPCNVQFAVKSTNDVGEYLSGEVGFYELYINRIKKEEAKGLIYGIPSGEITDNLADFKEKDINIIDISPYLPVADNVAVKIVIFNSDGVQQTVRDFSVAVSSMDLTWDYDEKTLNRWISGITESMQLEWSVSGGNLEKTTYITVDDNDYPYAIGSGTKTEFDYTLKFADFNMTHGAHTIKMWAVARVGIEEIPTEPIYKNIIVAKDDDPTTIISVNLFEKELTQYNTVSIPVYIYNKNNTAGTATVSLIENGSLKDQWTNVPNLGADPNKSMWNYTPTIAGDAIILTVQSGGQEYSTTVAIKGIDISFEEKPNYAFKFKANEFSSNANIQNWNMASFSDRFDWINGGLQSEDDDEGGRRQYFAIKAGSTMTINYDMWAINAPAKGKHFKFIFKATNCRDYDAQVLSCKADRKISFIDKTVEYYLLDNPTAELTYGDSVKIVNGQLEILNLKTEIFDTTTEESQAKLSGKYVDFGEKGIYQCDFLPLNPDDPNSKKYNAWYKISIKDSFQGLLIRAQNAEFNSNNETLDVQFCEDSYIELEIEITEAINKQGYVKFWVDGIPTGYVIYYSDTDRFILEDIPITIGSPDCDVYVYLAKLYESELSIEEHMENFYSDAPNAEEMVRRYRRNDIMNDSIKTEIDMYKLAEANPDLLVHHYDVPHMPITKKDKTYPCSYEQYKGSRLANLSATGVMIKVQGTSSEKYVLSAANLDTDFQFTDNNNVPSGLIDTKTGEVLVDGWSMDGGKAIPINYTCTKVNVASCENVNNAINQEWYNRFQPYKSVLRCKNKRARDTMQFTNGVIFVTDRNTKTDDPKGISNNVFAEVKAGGKSYLDAPYAKMYSIGQMGNSKDNTHVFHDESNPLECCVEVADNQMPQQWMIDDNYNHADIGEKEKLFEFRYPDGVDNASQEMINGWNNFVSWMAHANPQPRYNKFENITSESQYNDFAINRKTFTSVDVYVMNEEETEYVKVNGFDPNISTYYTLTPHIYGYTNLILDLPEEQRTFAPKKFKGFIAENQIDDNGQKWQKDYNPMIAGCTVDKYAGIYTHDTYEYRMAKMLQECEDHLIMDSVLYHYLFIERHCMIDNVAKNTFWSTEDCVHWSLIKDYDNDTADGTDNQGKFTRNYGMEPSDKLNPNAYVFNAHQSVWFNFCHGIKEACQYMYQQLENATITDDGKTYYNVWDSQAYLKLCSTWQKMIPERCWIEDYYRKYFRPNEVYKNNMFNSMLSGGPKKFQRKQYETYQDLYMSSKYQGIKLSSDYLIFRPTGTGLSKIKIPAEVYSDCYIYSNVGGQIAAHRAKRNEAAYLTCPVDELGNATMYIHPGSQFTKLGSLDSSGQLGTFAPDQMSMTGAKKLRELIFATSDMPTKNYGLERDLGFKGTKLLEKIYIANLVAYNQSLDLSDCTSLLELDATNSGFTGISIAAGAPVTSIRLESPTALEFSDLYNLQELKINSYNKLNTLSLHNIDNTKNLSKTIMTKTLDMIDPNDSTTYVQYHLTDAKWSIDNPNEMTSTNIHILDKMLNPSYTKPALGADDINRLPYSAAFTGEIEISSEAYSGNDPLTLYNKYISDSTFANVDMSFEANSAKLYNVIIYDGDGVAFWSKKTVSGTALNEVFLSYGPNGAFDIKSLNKSPTAEFNYEFLKTWQVKDNNGTTIQTLSGDMPIGMNITEDLHIYPDFKESKRSYLISVKAKNPISGEITELISGTFEYGTNLETILTSTGKKPIPYVEDSLNTLALQEGYNFKGYSLVPDSSILISENNYVVRGADTLWAVFEFTKNLSTIVHPEWFAFVTEKNTGEGNPYFEPDSTFHITGAVIKPVTTDIGGKITIPATIIHDGTEYPVVGIQGFSNSNITHVFMESKKTNKLYIIGSQCFYGLSSLKYFDFENCAVRYIGNEAFRGCSALYANTFGNQLYRVGERSFTGALDPNISEINLSASVVELDEYAIANNLNTKVNNILNIGSENNKSNLLLASRGGQSAINAKSLAQNEDYRYKIINFWTSQYSNAQEIISGTTTVADWFANNGVLANDGTLYLNGVNN